MVLRILPLLRSYAVGWTKMLLAACWCYCAAIPGVIVQLSPGSMPNEQKIVTHKPLNLVEQKIV
jgi:hypothetical protein